MARAAAQIRRGAASIRRREQIALNMGSARAAFHGYSRKVLRDDKSSLWRQILSESARFPNREYDGRLIRGTGDFSTTWPVSFGNLATGEGNLALASWHQPLPATQNGTQEALADDFAYVLRLPYKRNRDGSGATRAERLSDRCRSRR
jgi:hypothetical protein